MRWNKWKLKIGGRTKLAHEDALYIDHVGVSLGFWQVGHANLLMTQQLVKDDCGLIFLQLLKAYHLIWPSAIKNVWVIVDLLSFWRSISIVKPGLIVFLSKIYWNVVLFGTVFASQFLRLQKFLLFFTFGLQKLILKVRIKKEFV